MLLNSTTIHSTSFISSPLFLLPHSSRSCQRDSSTVYSVPILLLFLGRYSCTLPEYNIFPHYRRWYFRTSPLSTPSLKNFQRLRPWSTFGLRSILPETLTRSTLRCPTPCCRSLSVRSRSRDWCDCVTEEGTEGYWEVNSSPFYGTPGNRSHRLRHGTTSTLGRPPTTPPVRCIRCVKSGREHPDLRLYQGKTRLSSSQTE